MLDIPFIPCMIYIPPQQQAAQQAQQQNPGQPTDQQLFQLYTTIASVYGNDVSPWVGFYY